MLERELRKRVFWIIYGGSVTLGAVEDLPPLMEEDECAQLSLPLAL